jgi:hypothetical protein
MDRVERAEFGRRQPGRRLNDPIGDAHQRRSPKDRFRPIEQSSPPSNSPDGSEDLHPSQDARYDLRVRTESLHQRGRLRLGQNEFQDGRGIQVEHGPSLQSLRPFLRQGLAQSGGRPTPRGEELEQVSFRGRSLPRAHQNFQRSGGFRQRREHRNRPSPLRHLEAGASLHPPQIHAQILAELTNSDSRQLVGHVAHGST